MGDTDEDIPTHIQDSPRPWYRRPNSINRKSKPNTYYKITIIEEIRSRLLDVGGMPLLQRFQQGPFGHFIGWGPGVLASQALHSIVCRSVHTQRGIWFHICGGDIEYSIEDHALITGLNFGYSNFDSTSPPDLSTLSTFRVACNGVHMSGADLLGRFRNPRNNIDDPEGEIHFRIAHVLMAYVFVFGHDSQKTVFSWLWALVEDLDSFYRFPWGAYSYKILRNYIRKIPDSVKYHFYGPAWALMVWGLEVIPGFEAMSGRQREIDFAYPRCVRWNFRKHLDVTSVEDLYECFDTDAYNISNLVADEVEQGRAYHQSIWCAHPLAVRYMPLSNPIAKGGMTAEQRAPRHRVEVVEPVSSRRATRNVQPPPVEDTEPLEHGADPEPSERPPRRRRDTGKRARVPMRESSSSSSGGRTERALSQIRGEMSAFEARMMERQDRMEARIMERHDDMKNTFKKWMIDLLAAFRCGTSSRPAPIRHSQGQPPPVSQSARPSMQADRPSMQSPRPSDFQATSPRPVHAGEGAVGSSSGAPWSVFDLPHEPPPFVTTRHSSANYGSTQFPWPFDAQPVNVASIPSTSCDDTASAEFAGDFRTIPRPAYVPKEMPDSVGEDTLTKWKEFMKKAAGSYVTVSESGFQLSVADFKLILSMKQDFYIETIDLYMMTLEARLMQSDSVLPSHTGGRTVFTRCSFFCRLESDYNELLQQADAMNLEGWEARRAYFKMEYKPHDSLCDVIHARGLGSTTMPWWKATIVIFPIVIHGHFVLIVADMMKRNFHLFDSLWHKLSDAVKKERIRSLAPISVLLPLVMSHAFYWRHQELGITEVDSSFKWRIPAPTDQFKQLDSHSCGPFLCMAAERMISGSPSIVWGNKNVKLYRTLVAQRIFSYCV